MTHNTPRPGFVATLASLGSQFTEQSTDVWCTFADKPAGTNFDGATYFCQYCGATDHLAAQAHAAADAYDAAVARIAPRDRRVKTERFTFRGVNRNGRGSGGQFRTDLDNVGKFVKERYDAGWRKLNVTREAGDEVGGISNIDGEREWWVETADPFAAGGLLSELSVSHRADQD